MSVEDREGKAHGQLLLFLAKMAQWILAGAYVCAPYYLQDKALGQS